MTFFKKAIAAASLVALASPVAIAGPYEDAAATGVSPVTASEMLDCANYWRAWADSLNPDFYGEDFGIWAPSFIETLPEAVQLPAARETADIWFARAEAEYGSKSEYDAAYEVLYEYDVQSLSERKFLGMLGGCKRPD